MSVEDLIEVPGFQKTMATKISESIAERLQCVSIINIMAASNIFGRGFSEKRLSDIMLSNSDILVSKDNVEQKIELVKSTDGISVKSATQFVENIPNFIDFLNNTNLTSKLVSNYTNSFNNTNKLSGKIFVLTGFRDEEFQEYITKNGGKIGNTITKKTNALIVKEINYKENSKTVQANDKGISIITKEELYEW